LVRTNKEIVHCSKVSKQYGYFFALKNVSFKIKENTIFGIAGSNGAGKTTLIKILSGLIKPSIGKIEVQGMNYDDNRNQIRRIIGIATDESFLYEELTIYENLKFYDNLHYNFDRRNINFKIDKLTKLFLIDDWLQEPIRNLSHGMKQKVELIRVLMHNPSIIFLDEPFSGLDYKTIDILIRFFDEMKLEKKITLIISSHKIDLLKQICDDLIILKQGRINKSISRENYNEIEIESFF